MKRLLLPVLLIFCLSLGLSAHEKLAKELEQVSDDQMVDVIVQYRLAPTPAHHDRVRRLGGKLNRELSEIKAGAYSLQASGVKELANDPDVAYITPDRVVRGAALDYAQATIGSTIALNHGYNGAGVGVAVIDSGVSNNEDLKSGGATRIVYNESFISGGTDDHYGHGEHVAGIIAGNGSRSTGQQYAVTFRGVAPNAQVINLRVLDQNGNGTDSAVISAIGRAIQLKTKYNIRIINLSLGRPVYENYRLDPLCQAVEQAWRAGIVVVAAAGNEGRNNSAGTNGYGTIMSSGQRSLRDNGRSYENNGYGFPRRRSDRELQLERSHVDRSYRQTRYRRAGQPDHLIVLEHRPTGSHFPAERRS